MNKKRILAIIILSSIEAINQYILFFTLHMLMEAILEKVAKVLLAFVVDRNAYIRIKDEMSFSMSAHHWESISILFVLYFGLVSAFRMYFGLFKKYDKNSNYNMVYNSCIIFFMFLFLVGGYFYIIVLNHTIYKSNPYEASIGIFLAFLTPYLYYRVIGIMRNH